MIEIICDKCKKRVAVAQKTISAKTLSKCGFEAIALREGEIYHICNKCMEDLDSWVETPDETMR